MVEAQRLRDLHFRLRAPDTKLTMSLFRNADKLYPTLHDPRERGTFFTSDKDYADGFGYGLTKEYLIDMKNPVEIPDAVLRSGMDSRDRVLYKLDGSGYDGIVGHDVVFTDNLERGHLSNEFEIIVPYPRQAKLRDPITYDDAGNIIPLFLRDDFNSDDIRYQISSSLSEKHQEGMEVCSSYRRRGYRAGRTLD